MLLVNIQNDLKAAQLARGEVKVSTLRLLLSEVINAQIERGGELGEKDIISIIQKEVKKRKEAAEGFRKGGREDSALMEEAELAVLQGYLPQQLSNEELTKLVEDTITELEAKGLITELGANSLQDMGKVIGAVMGKATGRADGAAVSALAKEKLTT